MDAQLSERMRHDTYSDTLRTREASEPVSCSVNMIMRQGIYDKGSNSEKQGIRSMPSRLKNSPSVHCYYAHKVGSYLCF